MMKRVLSEWVLIALLASPLKLPADAPPAQETPQLYSATVQISVQDTIANTSLDAEETSPNPYFYRIQIAILQSKPILNEVAHRLNLSEKWSMENQELYPALKTGIQIAQIPNTSLFEITVRRPDPNEAAMIANEIAGTYRDACADLLLEKQRRAMDKLQTTLGEQRAKVAAAEERVKQLQEELGISEDGRRTLEGAEANLLQQLETDRLAAQKTMDQKTALLASLDGLAADELMTDPSPVEFDASIVKTILQLEEVSAELKREGIQKGPNHPDVKRYRIKKDKLKEVLGEQLNSLRRRLAMEYRLAQENLDRLDQNLADIRRMETQFNDDKYRPYRQTILNLESEQLIYQHLESKVQMELIKLKQPPENPVKIISIASPE